MLNQTLTGSDDTVAGVALDLQTQASHTVMVARDHTKSMILTNLVTYTAFFILTHGAEAAFGDCFRDPGGSGELLNTMEVSTAVNAKGTSLPPYAFVHWYACSVVANENAAMPGAFGISNSSIDRACVGWRYDMAYGGGNDLWHSDLWDAMCIQGMTLNEAIAQADAHQVAMGYGGPGCWKALFTDKTTAKVFGDGNMKVHGVYGGQGLQWYL